MGKHLELGTSRKRRVGFPLRLDLCCWTQHLDLGTCSSARQGVDDALCLWVCP